MFDGDHCLLQIEPDAKWALLTLARLREAQAQQHGGLSVADNKIACQRASSEAASGAAQTAADSALDARAPEDASAQGAQKNRGAEMGAAEIAGLRSDASSHVAEARTIYSKLAGLDPLRRGYYQDAAAGKAHVVVRALGGS